MARGMMITFGFLPALVMADGSKALSLQAQLGTNLYQHRFRSGGRPAMNQTVADEFQLVEQLAAAGWWSDTVELGLQLQFSEEIGHGTLSEVQFQPFVGWQPTEILNLTLALVLAPQTGGHREFGFGVQPSIGTNVKLGEHLQGVLTVQLPIILEPRPIFQIAPLIGISYDR